MSLASNDQPVAIRELDFGQHVLQPRASHRRAVARACALAIAAHICALLALLAAQRFHTVRVGTTIPQRGIGAFVLAAPQPTGTTGVRPVEPKRDAVRKTVDPTPDTGQDREVDSASAQAGSGQATGTLGAQGAPVRLVAGVNVQLLKKVVPVYPPIMRSAGVPGVVVLDAVIHPDGTIGDITILKSSSPVFEQVAIAAVKQWLYTPIPYEGIVTVTLSFTIAG